MTASCLTFATPAAGTMPVQVFARVIGNLLNKYFGVHLHHQSKPMKTPVKILAAIVILIIIGYSSVSLYNSYRVKKINDEADAQHEYYMKEMKKAAKPH